MRSYFCIFLLLFTFSLKAQMLVYTVAGASGPAPLGDGGPATAADIDNTEGVWLDGNCNIYLSDKDKKIRKVNSVNNDISTVAGNDIGGYSGDGGMATNANLTLYGLFVDKSGNIYIADPDNNRVRKVDCLTGVITTLAGGGVTANDGGAATAALIDFPRNVYGDNIGNIYIGEKGRLRRVTSSGIITTIAGTGAVGLSGDGGPATAAQIANPHTMLFDQTGNLFFADRANNRIRKISPKGIITTYAGSTDGYSGDGGAATAAQLSGPVSFVIDYLGNMIIGDNQNNCMRRVDAKTGIITHFAGVGPSAVGSYSEGIPATAAELHPEFMYLDRRGNIYYSCWCRQIRKIINYLPAMSGTTNECGETTVPGLTEEREKTSIYPNPATNEIKITSKYDIENVEVVDILGATSVKTPESGKSDQYCQMLWVTKKEILCNISYLTTGVYFVKVNGIYAGRFVKSNY